MSAILNTEETYKALQPFNTIEELNANTAEIRAQFGDQFTPSTRAVLDVLARYSSKFYGVSYRSKSKIAEELGISRRTVIRACNALEALGVIKQVELFRHNGDKRQASNAIVFIALKPVNEVSVTPECHSVETPANAKKPSNTYVTEAPVVNSVEEAVKASEDRSNPNSKSQLKNALPDGWYAEASPYANSADDLYRITGELFKAKHETTLRVEDYVTEFGEVLRRAWFNLKNGRVAKPKWYAYLFAAFKKTAHLIERKERFAPMQRELQAFLFDA